MQICLLTKACTLCSSLHDSVTHIKCMPKLTLHVFMWWARLWNNMCFQYFKREASSLHRIVTRLSGIQVLSVTEICSDFPFQLTD